MTFDFYFYGSEYDAFIKAIKVLNHIFGTDLYTRLLHLSFLIGIISAAYWILMGRRQEEFFRHLILVIAIAGFFLSYNVNIKVHPYLGQNYVVPSEGNSFNNYNLPVGLALPLWMSNTLSNALVKLVDKGFGCPVPGESGGGSGDSLIGTDLLCYTHYGAGGVMGMIAALQDVSHYQQEVSNNLQLYAEYCLLPALDLRAMTRDGIAKAPDLVNYIETHSLVNWHGPYKTVPDLHGGDNSYPGSYSTCSLQSNSGDSWIYNCNCKDMFRLIKSDLDLLKEQFEQSLLSHRGIGAFFGGSNTAESYLETLLATMYGELCTTSNCPGTTQRILSHLYTIRSIDFLIAQAGDDYGEIQKLVDRYRAITAGWRGHGYFMFYFLPKIRMIFFIVIPILFLASIPFAFAGSIVPFLILIPNLMFVTMWDPILAFLNDIFASELSDQIFRLTGVYGGTERIGITNGNLFDVFTVANEKMALFGYAATFSIGMAMMLANGIVAAWIRRGAQASGYALERGLQPVGQGVGEGATRAGVESFAREMADYEAEKKMMVPHSPNGEIAPPPKPPWYWQESGNVLPGPGEFRARSYEGKALESLYAGAAAGAMTQELLDHYLSPERIGMAGAFDKETNVARTETLRNQQISPDELGEIKADLEGYGAYGGKEKINVKAYMLAQALAKNPETVKQAFKRDLIPSRYVSYDEKTGKYTLTDPEGFARYLSHYPTQLGKLESFFSTQKDFSSLTGFLTAGDKLVQQGVFKDFDQFIEAVQKGQMHKYLPGAIKGGKISAEEAIPFLIREITEGIEGFKQEVLGFVKNEKGFKSLSEAEAWWKNASMEDRMAMTEKLIRAGVLARAMEKSRLASIVSSSQRVIGKDRTAEILSSRGMLSFLNEYAKAIDLLAPGYILSGKTNEYRNLVSDFVKSVGTILPGGEKAAIARLTHHGTADIPIVDEGQKENLKSFLVSQGINPETADAMLKDAKGARLRWGYDDSGNLKLIGATFTAGDETRVIYTEPTSEKLGSVGQAIITGGTGIVRGDMKEIKDATARIGRTTLNGFEAAYNLKTGRVTEFKGGLSVDLSKVPEANRAKVAEAEFRKVLGGLGASYDANSAGFRRAVEALAGGRQVSINYNNGHLQLREGSHTRTGNQAILYDNQQTIDGTHRTFYGREFKDVNTSTIGGQNLDFYFRADMDHDGTQELYHFQGKGYLKDGIFNGEGNLYYINNDGKEIALNTRGLAHVKNLMIDGLYRPEEGQPLIPDFVPEAKSTPTFKMPLYSFGAEAKMSAEGVRSILSTFKAATMENKPLNMTQEQWEETKERAQYMLHRLENDEAFRQAFVRGYKALFGTLVDEKHAVDVAASLGATLKGYVRREAGGEWDTTKAFWGRWIERLSGAKATALAKAGWQVEGKGSLQKTSKDATTVDKIGAVAQGVLEEKSLDDNAQMKVLASLWDKKMEMAVQTVRGVTGRFDADRSVIRVLSGVIPGMDTGRTAEGWAHAFAQTNFYKFITGDNPVGAAVRTPYWMFKAMGEMGKGMDKARLEVWQQALQGNPENTQILESIKEARKDIKSFESGKELLSYIERENSDLINEQAKEKLSAINSSVVLLPTGEVITEKGKVFDFGQQDFGQQTNLNKNNSQGEDFIPLNP